MFESDKTLCTHMLPPLSSYKLPLPKAKPKEAKPPAKPVLKASNLPKASKPPKLQNMMVTTNKPKKTKKNSRQRALRRAENEDPPLERLKQVREN